MKVWLLSLQLCRVVSYENNCEPEDLEYNCIVYHAEYTNGVRSVCLEYRAAVNSCGEHVNDTKVTGEEVDFQLVKSAVEALHELIAQINGAVGKVHNNN